MIGKNNHLEQPLTDSGKWRNGNCAIKQNAICEKTPIINVTPDPDDSCSGAGCCTGHVGLEIGGIMPDSAFSGTWMEKKQIIVKD